MKKVFGISLFALSSLANANPFVISDPLSPGVTQCGVLLDTNPKVTIPVTAVVTPAPANICKFDIRAVTPGSHTIKMTAITVSDPVFGSQESATSLPLVFVVPTAPIAPSGLQLAP